MRCENCALYGVVRGPWEASGRRGTAIRAGCTRDGGEESCAGAVPVGRLLRREMDPVPVWSGPAALLVASLAMVVAWWLLGGGA